MKIFIILISILISPLASLAQSNEEMEQIIINYSIDGNSLNYIETFDVPGKSAEEIKDLLIKTYSTRSSIFLDSNSLLEDQITGEIKSYNIEYKKYNTNRLATTFLYNPIFAKLSFQIKDEKYRVIISSISASAEKFDTTYLKNGKWRNKAKRKRNIHSLNTLGMNFHDLLSLESNVDQDEW